MKLHTPDLKAEVRQVVLRLAHKLLPEQVAVERFKLHIRLGFAEHQKVPEQLVRQGFQLHRLAVGGVRELPRALAVREVGFAQKAEIADE